MSLLEHADLDKLPKTVWLATEHPNSYQHAYYIILRAIMREKPDNVLLIKQLKRAFNPIVNTRKLANGRRQYDTLRYTLHTLIWSKPFLPVSDDQHQLVKKKAHELCAMVTYNV